MRHVPVLRFLAALAAVFCFGVAFILAVGWVSGGNERAWQEAGLFSLALAFLIPPTA